MTSILVLVALVGLAVGQDEPPLSEADFEILPAGQQFAAEIAELDLNAPDFTFTYKASGTSVGMRIYREGAEFAKWVPQNSATDVEAQVVSYRLSQFLAMSELAVPSAYHTISGRARDEFETMLLDASESDTWRVFNRDQILSDLQGSSELLGVITAPVESSEVSDLVDTAANTINAEHPIAAFIRATGDQPSAEETLTLRGVRTGLGRAPTASEAALARGFSKIMVLDLLCGQWDRWSGGNVEAAWDEASNHVQFIARDNGGASMSSGTAAAEKYLDIVSRFDRAQIDRVVRLAALLEFQPQETAAALALRSGPKSLRDRARMLLQHVADLESEHGAEQIYFAD